MKPSKRTTFPSLRCTMGDWVYYITFMRFSDVDHWIKRTDQVHNSKKLRDMIQRALTDRAENISEYLIKQKERFFNSIVVGVYDGAPQWYPIQVNDSPVSGSPDLDESSRNSIGLLKLEGNEKLFAIDGQHRVEAIKRTVKQKPELENEELSIIFLAHKTDEEGKKRTRRLFSTLNRYAKKVSEGQIIALDEDDAFAIVTRRLIEEFPLLESELDDSGFVYFGPTSPLKQSDKQNLTTLLIISKIANIIYCRNKKNRKTITPFRPSDETLDEIYEEQTKYWNLLEANIKEYSELFKSNPSDKIACKYRHNDGGHFMFRPAGQNAFARAVSIMMSRKINMEEAIKSLLFKVPTMELNKPPWEYVLWDTSAQKIIKSNSALIVNILLHYVNQPPVNKYKTLDRYRKVINKSNADLPSSKRRIIRRKR